MSSPNVFVEMTKQERLVVVLAVGLYAVIIGTFAAFHGQPGTLLNFLILCLYLMVLMLPIVSPGLGTGWLHPLVFGSLWTFVRWVLPKSRVFVLGLQEHIALPGYAPSDLTWLVSYGLLLDIIALLATYAGFLLLRNVRVGLRIFFVNPKWPQAKMFVMAGVSLAALAVLVVYAGGLDEMLLQRGLRRDLRVSALLGGQWAVIVKFLVTAAIVWAGTQKKTFSSIGFWTWTLLGIVIQFIATGSRGAIIQTFLVLGMIWILHRQKIPWKLVVICALIGLAGLGALGELRRSTFGASSIEDLVLNINLIQSIRIGVDTLVEYSVQAHALYPILAKVPDEVPFLYGSSFFTILAAPIPRALWPGKPVAPGRLASEYFFGNPWNTIPAGSVGEAYWNMHVVGVILTFLAWGIVLRFLARILTERSLGTGTFAFYALTVVALEPSTEAVYRWLHSSVLCLAALLILSGIPRIQHTRRRLPG